MKDIHFKMDDIEPATDNIPKTIFSWFMGFREMSEIGCCGVMKG